MTPSPYTSAGSRPAATAANPSFISDPRNACHQCSQLGHRSPSCRNPQVLFCWACGKIGVRTIECCRSDKTNLRGVATTPLVRNTTTTPSRIQLRVGTLRCNGRSLLASVTSGNHSWRGILDTGSWRSFVNAKTAARLQSATNEPKPCHYQAVLANGQRQNVTKSLAVSLEIDCQQYAAELLVLPKSTDSFILGMDALAALNTTIQVGETTLQISGAPAKTRLARAKTTTPGNNPQTQWPAWKITEFLKNPQEYPEYVVENGRLYRHFPATTYNQGTTPRK